MTPFSGPEEEHFNNSLNFLNLCGKGLQGRSVFNAAFTEIPYDPAFAGGDG